ncbi:ABC transporter ATP-binding protein [Leucobacter sp. BZR 635]
MDVRFEVGASVVTALEGYTLDIAEGEFVAVLGPSGCGKSTSLNLLAGFDRATGGRVLLNGKTVAKPGPDRGVVFQNANLLPWLNVWENVVFGPKVKGVAERDYSERAREMLSLVKLDGFEKHLPGQLSGGMQQRASIARALINDPDVLLMDEPFGALDAQTRISMQELLLQIWEQDKRTVMFITHDIDEALLLADRVVIMTGRPGKIREQITVDFPRPRNYQVTALPAFQELKQRLLTLLQH